MMVENRHYRTIWAEDGDVFIIDQRHLPHRFIIESLSGLEDMARAISDMHVRGAGLIGAAAGYGMYLAVREGIEPQKAADILIGTRPTAANLGKAVKRQLEALEGGGNPVKVSFEQANAIADEDADFCRRIGEHGLRIIEDAAEKGPVNILTHCNAGWLAFVDHGSALSPVYAAHDTGIDVHVWVDETRPVNQGARLTCWELSMAGIKHTLITDNTGGHLMQNGMVDLCIVGSDRTNRFGDVANKIGTYLKAVAAWDNKVPFYAALPSTTFDLAKKDIPIEQRDGDEVRYVQGLADGRIMRVLVSSESTPAANYAFDVTPSRLVTGLITERGICEASERGILGLFPNESSD